MKLPPRHAPRDGSNRPKVRPPLAPPPPIAEDKIDRLAVDLAREWSEDGRAPLSFPSSS